jgi:hypothetical protein
MTQSDKIAALQARLEAAEQRESERDTEHDDALARIVELEKPVTDEEVTQWTTPLDFVGPTGTHLTQSAAEAINKLIRRLSRQSKSNALLGKCEEALKKHLLCNVHRMAHGGGTVHVGVRCDGCDAEAEKLAALVHEPTCILSQIEQSKQPEVKETR